MNVTMSISSWELIHRLALGSMLLVAVWHDVSRRIIPNRAVVLGSVVAIALSVMPSGLGVWAALLGGLVAFLSFLFLHLLSMLGAGDVKLAAASGLYFSPVEAFDVCLTILMVGGLVALVWGVVTRNKPAQKIPYALAIAMGIGLHTLLKSHA